MQVTGPDGYSLCVLNNVKDSVIVVSQENITLQFQAWDIKHNIIIDTQIIADKQ